MFEANAEFERSSFAFNGASDSLIVSYGMEPEQEALSISSELKTVSPVNKLNPKLILYQNIRCFLRRSYISPYR